MLINRIRCRFPNCQFKSIQKPWSNQKDFVLADGLAKCQIFKKERLSGHTSSQKTLLYRTSSWSSNKLDIWRYQCLERKNNYDFLIINSGQNKFIEEFSPNKDITTFNRITHFKEILQRQFISIKNRRNVCESLMIPSPL